MQAAQDFKELKNKIIEQIENICSKSKKLEEDCEDVQELENELERKIKIIKYNCSNFKGILEDWKKLQELQEEEDAQQLLTRLGERKDLEDEKGL